MEVEEEEEEEDVELESEDDDDDNDDHETFKLMMKRKLEEAGDENEKPVKKMKKDNDLYKPPTVEELNQLRETETLFHSNLFRLQIEEVLTEVKPKDKYKKQFDLWFKKFKDAVMSIKETEDKEVKIDKILFRIIITND